MEGTAKLTPATQLRLRSLFRPEEQAEVEHVLVQECGLNLPLLAQASADQLERIRFAALKLSAGNLARLREAVSLAQRDWRDVLVEAGFGEDARAHQAWMPGT